MSYTPKLKHDFRYLSWDDNGSDMSWVTWVCQIWPDNFIHGFPYSICQVSIVTLCWDLNLNVNFNEYKIAAAYEYRTLSQKWFKEKWTQLTYTGDEKSPTKSKMYQILDKKRLGPLEVNTIS